MISNLKTNENGLTTFSIIQSIARADHTAIEYLNIKVGISVKKDIIIIRALDNYRQEKIEFNCKLNDIHKFNFNDIFLTTYTDSAYKIKKEIIKQIKIAKAL